MKKVIGGFAALAFLFVVASCGGASEADLIGKWSVDPSSIDIKLGDGVPSEMKAMVKEGKKEMMAEGSEDMKAATIEFKEGGKLVVGAEGQSQEGTWSLDGDNLTLGMEEGGQKMEVTVQVEMDGDSMTATLTAEEIMKLLKESGMDQMIQAQAGAELDKMVDGTSISVTFNKK
ncbi:MAG: hypothetical protein Crog4KO_03250 [Crocinitomicaceae bacterium]